MTNHTWVQNASCAGTDPDVFFPDKGGSVHAAKQLCNVCPVTAACLREAITDHLDFGVWGGLSQNDRKRLRRQAA